MMLKLFAAVSAGWGCHHLRPFLVRFAHGWRDLLLYGTGTLFAAPFVMLIHDELEYVHGRRQRLMFAYFAGFGAFGLGTLLGWLYDSAEESQ